VTEKEFENCEYRGKVCGPAVRNKETFFIL